MKSLDDFQGLYNDLPIASVMTRASDGLVLKANSKFLDLLGANWSESAGRTLVDLGITTAETRDRIKAEMDAGGDVVSFNFLIRKGAGGPRPARLTVRRETLNGEQFFIKAVEDSPADEERILADLDLAPFGVLRVSLARRIQAVNLYFQALTGYRSEELVGTDALDLLAPGSRRDVLMGMQRHRVRYGTLRTRDFSMLTKDGRTIFVRAKSISSPGADGAFEQTWCLWNRTEEETLRRKLVSVTRRLRQLARQCEEMEPRPGDDLGHPAPGARPSDLNERELVWLGHLTRGLSNRAIAALTGRSVEVVKVTNSRLYKRIGVRNRLQLLAWLARDS